MEAATQVRTTLPDSYPEKMDFNDLDLSSNVLRGIFAYGFEKPSEIQGQAIYPMIQGRDLIAQAKSGTGKTGAFVIGSIARMEKILMEERGEIVLPDQAGTPLILIICHTHELAAQIKSTCDAINEFTKYRTVSVTATTPIRNTIIELSQPVDIVVGTPGRLLDMMQKNKLDTGALMMCVIDEADQLFKGSFIPQIHTIFSTHIPNRTQVGIFSATLNSDIISSIESTVRPKQTVKILLPDNEVTVAGIEQFYITVYGDGEKIDVLEKLYQHLSLSQTIIFVNSVERAEILYDQLDRRGHTSALIHADLPSNIRQKTMAQFRRGDSRILVATDVIARGIDVQQVSVVINFDMPSIETYVHRVGRSGRYGRKGIAISFISVDSDGPGNSRRRSNHGHGRHAPPSDMSIKRNIELTYSTTLKPVPQLSRLREIVSELTS
jgi:translation initiation factor 4A